MNVKYYRTLNATIAICTQVNEEFTIACTKFDI